MNTLISYAVLLTLGAALYLYYHPLRSPLPASSTALGEEEGRQKKRNERARRRLDHQEGSDGSMRDGARAAVTDRSNATLGTGSGRETGTDTQTPDTPATAQRRMRIVPPSSPSASSTSSSPRDGPTTAHHRSSPAEPKKARQNAAKRERARQQKQAEEADRQERLHKHQQDLDRVRLEELTRMQQRQPSAPTSGDWQVVGKGKPKSTEEEALW